MHHGDEIGDLPHKTQIVRDQQAGQGVSGLKIEEKIQDLGLSRKIQT